MSPVKAVARCSMDLARRDIWRGRGDSMRTRSWNRTQRRALRPAEKYCGARQSGDTCEVRDRNTYGQSSRHLMSLDNLLSMLTLVCLTQSSLAAECGVIVR